MFDFKFDKLQNRHHSGEQPFGAYHAGGFPAPYGVAQPPPLAGLLALGAANGFPILVTYNIFILSYSRRSTVHSNTISFKCINVTASNSKCIEPD